MIEYISYEETDEFLTYEMQRLIRYHDEHNDLPEFHKVADIIPDMVCSEPLFKDTMLLEAGDNEMVPHRELYFTLNHKGRPFTIVLRHLLPGRDDVAEGTLLIIVGLLLLMATVLILMLNSVARKLWRPFYDTLKRISAYKIGSAPPSLNDGDIDEFNLLNKTIRTLLHRIDSDFKRNKEFNENLSHELQTHLAVIRSTTETILNQTTGDLESTTVDGLRAIYSSVNKLHQVQKSLMLLSKIGNFEYNKTANINFRDIVQQMLERYAEAFELRGIKVVSNLSDCHLSLDAGLAEILVNNLFKNALKHNVNDGYVTVLLTAQQFIIENSGLPYNGDPEQLFQRFTKGEKGNYGIGLSIVKQIGGLYNYSVSYKVAEHSKHIIVVSFDNRCDRMH
jgi:signal transduction histidine kinase